MKAQSTIPSISIIVPTLNEQDNIGTTLRSIPPAPEVEVIVVDGGSDDGTVERARACDVCVLAAPRGRARQMNTGAAAAKGELLLFLHADTILPDDYDYHVRRILLEPENAVGAFRLHIDAPSRGLRFIEAMANWRSRRLKMPYGDQALFMRTTTFHEVGGYPEMPIMEDYEIIRRLQKLGRVVIASAAVNTSARRWQNLGLWRTTAVNQAIVIGYTLGVSPDRLEGWYHRRRS